MQSLENNLRERSVVYHSVLEVRPRNAPESEPIAWVSVVKTETKYFKDDNKSIRYDSIELIAKLIFDNRVPLTNVHVETRFCGHFDALENSASLTTTGIGSGAVFMDLPNLKGERIGTYLFSQIVEFVKQWPTASINQINLNLSHAEEAENKVRRNALYENCGIMFKYSDPTHLKLSGHSEPMIASNLIVRETWDWNKGTGGNIKIIETSEFIGSMLAGMKKQSEQIESMKMMAHTYKQMYFSSWRKIILWGACAIAASIVAQSYLTGINLVS